jgi:hypothetical protein
MAATKFVVSLRVTEAVAQPDRNVIKHHFDSIDECSQVIFIDA